MDKPKINSLYKHMKTGNLYRVIGNALLEHDASDVVIYYSLDTKVIWVRPLEEFVDGRFKLIK